MRTAISPAVTVIRVPMVPTIVLPSSFPAKKSSGRTVERMISTTRDDFSSVIRDPTLAANIIMNDSIMSVPNIIVVIAVLLLCLAILTGVTVAGGKAALYACVSTPTRCSASAWAALLTANSTAAVTFGSAMPSLMRS